MQTLVSTFQAFALSTLNYAYPDVADGKGVCWAIEGSSNNESAPEFSDSVGDKFESRRICFACHVA